MFCDNCEVNFKLGSKLSAVTDDECCVDCDGGGCVANNVSFIVFVVVVLTITDDSSSSCRLDSTISSLSPTCVDGSGGGCLVFEFFLNFFYILY